MNATWMIKRLMSEEVQRGISINIESPLYIRLSHVLSRNTPGFVCELHDFHNAIGVLVITTENIISGVTSPNVCELAAGCLDGHSWDVQ